MTPISPILIARHEDFHSGDREKNDGMRVLDSLVRYCYISLYLRHRHRLLFRHRHWCPGVAGFLPVADVPAVVNFIGLFCHTDDEMTVRQ